MIVIISLSFFLYAFNEHLVSRMSSDYLFVQKFVGSIKGYFLLIANELDYETGYKIGAVYTNQTGPLINIYSYFSQNPLEIFFGKGITYSFMNQSDLQFSPFGQSNLNNDSLFYMGLSSDFYILTYFEQYGIFGTLFLTIIYLIYPLLLLIKKHCFMLYIPIIFYLSTFHYPPQISKIIMIFVALSIWYIYMKPKTEHENI